MLLICSTVFWLPYVQQDFAISEAVLNDIACNESTSSWCQKPFDEIGEQQVIYTSPKEI